jgi:hypothetical protein
MDLRVKQKNNSIDEWQRRKPKISQQKAKWTVDNQKSYVLAECIFEKKDAGMCSRKRGLNCKCARVSPKNKE